MKKLQKRLLSSLVEAASCRPLLTVSVCFCLLHALLFSCSKPLCLALSAGLFVFFGLSFLFARAKGVETFRLFAGLLALGALLCLFGNAGTAVRDAAEEARLSPFSQRGEACSVTYEITDRAGELALVRLSEVDGVRMSDLLCLFSEEGRIGDVLTASATVAEARLTEGERFALRGETPRYELVLQGEPSVLGTSENLLSRLRVKVSDGFGALKSGSLLRALVLADHSELSSSLRDDLSATGLSHLMALSGLHLGLMMTALHRLLGVLWIDRRVRLCLVLFFGGWFVILCGVPMSLLRAYVMMVLAAAAELLRLRQSAVESLFCAAALIVLFDPAAWSDVGFRLSVLATLGVLLASPAAEKSFASSRIAKRLSESLHAVGFLRLARGVWSSFCVSFFALLFTLPTTLSVFGRAALFSPLYGPLFLVPFYLLLILGFCALFLCLCFGSLPACFIELTDGAAILFCRLLSACARISPTISHQREEALLCAVISLILFGLFVLWYRVRFRVAFCALPLFLAVLFSAEALFGTAFVSGEDLCLFGNTEESCLLVSAEAGRVLFIHERGENTADLAFLSRVGDEALDAVVFVDAGAHTADRAVRLCQRVRVGCLYLPETAEDEVLFSARSALEEVGTAVSTYAPGTRWTLCEITVVPMLGEQSVLLETAGHTILFSDAEGVVDANGAELLFFTGEGEVTAGDSCILYAAEKPAHWQGEYVALSGADAVVSLASLAT